MVTGRARRQPNDLGALGGGRTALATTQVFHDRDPGRMSQRPHHLRVADRHPTRIGAGLGHEPMIPAGPQPAITPRPAPSATRCAHGADFGRAAGWTRGHGSADSAWPNPRGGLGVADSAWLTGLASQWPGGAAARRRGDPAGAGGGSGAGAGAGTAGSRSGSGREPERERRGSRSGAAREPAREPAAHMSTKCFGLLIWTTKSVVHLFYSVFMLEALAQVGGAVDDCAETALWGLSDDELLASLDATQVLAQRLAAVQLGLVRELDGRGVAVAQGASSTAVWLRERLRLSGRTARQLVQLAATIDAAPPAVRDALLSGAITVEQGRVVAETIAALPVEAGPEVADKATQLLITWADRFDPTILSRLGERVLTHVAPGAGRPG